VSDISLFHPNFHTQLVLYDSSLVFTFNAYSSLAELVREREDKKNDLSQVQVDIFKKRCVQIVMFACVNVLLQSER